MRLDCIKLQRSPVTTLIESLKAEISRMEAKHGSDNLYVKDLKEQLRASEETSGKTAQEVYQMQTVQFAPSEIYPLAETEEDVVKAEALRRLRVRRLLSNYRRPMSVEST
jgi:uncharacterized protein (DUF433 family)